MRAKAGGWNHCSFRLISKPPIIRFGQVIREGYDLLITLASLLFSRNVQLTDVEFQVQCWDRTSLCFSDLCSGPPLLPSPRLWALSNQHCCCLLAQRGLLILLALAWAQHLLSCWRLATTVFARDCHSPTTLL